VCEREKGSVRTEARALDGGGVAYLGLDIAMDYASFMEGAET
jgi:hypothetical protein